MVLPGIQVYCAAPLAVSTTVLPEQTVGLEGDMLRTGYGVTIRANVLEPTQPRELVPLTVYVVEIKGVTICTGPRAFPGCQE